MSIGVTPRQTCPRPEGLGRNLRSKTRWFAGFCNSHQVSHFATFFIDARAEISVAESRVDLRIIAARGYAGKPALTRHKAIYVFLDAYGALGSVVAPYLQGRGKGAFAGPKTNGMGDTFTVCFVLRVTTMILPQVHLRKPCYDFSFL